MGKAIFILIFCAFKSNAQIGLSIEAIPNSVFANYSGGGVIPEGFFLKKYNFSFSGGASFYHVTNKRFTTRIGLNYFVNNYRSFYFKESESTKDPINRNTLQTSFFEPKFSLSYQFSVNSIKSIIIEAGIGASISNSPNYSIKTEFAYVDSYGVLDTIKTSVNVSSIKNVSPIKAYFSCGKSFDLFAKKTNKMTLDALMTYRYSRNEERIERTYLDDGELYNFHYFRNSSFLGATIRFNYQLN